MEEKNSVTHFYDQQFSSFYLPSSKKLKKKKGIKKEKVKKVKKMIKKKILLILSKMIMKKI
jgi:hypothetical protein